MVPHIVHPESFRSNAQIVIAFARRNRPRVHHNDEFACVYLHSRAFASTVHDRLKIKLRAYAYIHTRTHSKIYTSRMQASDERSSALHRRPRTCKPNH